MRVHVDHAWHHGLACGVDYFRVGWRDLVRGPYGGDLPAFDQDRDTLTRRSASTIHDQAGTLHQ
jgi:hypothetical protein